jgi:rod shape determining protein RodA
MSNGKRIYHHLDWYLIGVYLILVVFGWMNVYSSLNTEEHQSIFDFSQKYGMQMIWIATSAIIAALILFVINPKVYTVLSPIFYFTVLLMLFAVIFLGKEINGSKSWFALGPLSFQPAEISKISTALLLSYFMGRYGFKLNKLKDASIAALIILIPMLLIIMEKETGSALVYIGFVFVLYREGLSGWFLLFGIFIISLFVITLAFSPLVSLIFLILSLFVVDGYIRERLFPRLICAILTGTILSFIPAIMKQMSLSFISKVKPEYVIMAIIIPFAIWILIRYNKKRIRHIKYLIICFFCAAAFTFSVDFIFNNILQQHQRARIENLLGIQEDLMGVGYNVHQSKIAIGSGGLIGKGYLQGTQTKFNFVPEQSTDFIFCTVGEEWGFIGSIIIVALYIFMISRIITLAEKQKDHFARLYGYCIASIFFMHFAINIGMTIGLAPVIGIPLPFLSYGGSSLWTFTAMLFIFIRLDLDRWR